MHFNNFALKLASLVGLATFASAQAGFCPEALRFGTFQVSPSTLAPGDSLTVTANLTCAIAKGNTPTFLDYYIEVLANNNGHEPPILLARRTYDNTTSPPVDTFTTTLPSWFYFADAQYSVVMNNLFSRPGPTGEAVITVGGVSEGITITGI
ncbi:hypothetical protein C8J57DRAFT_1282053 [Mycena rebaudengoi]|nr:hypothetical protein C8J57DRAFT_1282053 [Mycena rebaudengoi]